MAETRHTIIPDPDSSDDDTYEPSADEESNTAYRIDALDYVSADHPLLPPRYANNVMTIKSRFQYHAEFWWDVFLAMQEQVYQEKNPNHYYSLRTELNERLKQETVKLRQQRTKDNAIIIHLRRVTPSTRIDDSETDTTLWKEIKRLRKESEAKDARLKRLGTTVNTLMQQSRKTVPF